MQTYRLYRLDGAANIVTADWLDADSDDDALQLAQERAEGGGFELWERDRLIGRSHDGLR